MLANRHIARFIDVLDRLDLAGSKVPGLILSHAGFGKTSTVKMFCDYKKYNLITLIPSMFSSDDILGIQSVKSGKLVRLTPSWFDNMMNTINSNHRRTVLFIDEITTCDPYIQGPLLDLIFNGNLGDAHLPEDVFIIAAGNYSSDLNSVFKMSAPLVNRFMILNLQQKDFNLSELVETDFDAITDDSAIKNFLELDTVDTPVYDFKEFKKWIAEGNEIEFGNCSYTEDETFGTLGFTSIRSVTYSLKFAQMYFQTFDDDNWSRIIGDTLGTSSKREGRPLQIIIKANINLFKNRFRGSNGSLDIKDLNRRWGAQVAKIPRGFNGLPDEDLDMLKNYITNLNVVELSAVEANSISGLIARYRGYDSRLDEISSIFNQKLDTIYG